MTNGIISFLIQVGGFETTPFPIGKNKRIIAPFWGDVDGRDTTGTVYYRQTTNTTFLNQATADIRLKFVTFVNFKATWGLIATWHNITHFDRGTKVCKSIHPAL